MILSLIRRLKHSELGRLYSDVAHNTLALGVLQAFNYFVPVVTVPYLVRTLGVERFGAVAFAGAFIQYFIRITDYGFNLSATREIAVCRAEPNAVSRTASAVLFVRMLLGSVCVAIGLGATYVIGSLAHERTLVLLSLLMVGGAMLSTTYLFQGMERMRYITYYGIGSKLLYFLGLFLLVHKSSDYIWVPMLTGLTDIAAGIAGIALAINVFNLKLVIPDKLMLREQLKAGWPVFTSMMAITAYSVTPTFAIGMFSDTTAAGYYAIAERILTPLQLFPLGPVVAALYPRMTSIFSRAPRVAYRLARHSQNITTGSYIVLTPILILLAPTFVSIVAGSAYVTTVLVLRILLISVFFIQANAFKLQFLLVAGASDIYARIHLLTAIMGCSAILLSAKEFSIVGPAISQTGTSAVILIWAMREVRKIAAILPEAADGGASPAAVLAFPEGPIS